MRTRKRYAARMRHADYTIIACTLFLVLFGLAMLSSASSPLAQRQFGDSYYYLKHQIFFGLTFGIAGFFLAAWLNYRAYERLALVLLLASIAFLALTLTSWGVEVKGATRWVALGPVRFQPSEFLKITFVLYLAAWLSKQGERQRNFWGGFFPFLVVTAVISSILLLQHSTSIVGILIATALAVYFASGAKLSYIAGFALVGAAGLALVIYFTPYRLNRVISFLEQESADVRGSGYQLEQARIAIGAGQTAGVGYGQSTTKINRLPESIGDSIFAVIGEELGFVGSAAMLSLFFLLVMRIFFLARRARDRFGQLLLVGFGAMIAVQVFVHVGAISGLIPLTGTPLPFVSYGGTALAVFMTMMGVVVNVSKYS